MVVDPRFNRSASVADFYAPIRSGSDIVFLGGVINYLLSNDKIHHEYVHNYTDFSFIVRDDYQFVDGIFSGYDEEKRTYDKKSWDYELGEDGFVKTDPTLQHPRCVYQWLKRHYASYTPEPEPQRARDPGRLRRASGAPQGGTAGRRRPGAPDVRRIKPPLLAGPRTTALRIRRAARQHRNHGGGAHQPLRLDSV
jgi:hypothetical protein